MLNWLTHEPWDLPVSTSPAQRFQMCRTMPNFLIFLLKMGSGPNSGPDAYVANISLIE